MQAFLSTFLLILILTFLSANFLPKHLANGNIELTEQMEKNKENNKKKEVNEKGEADNYLRLLLSIEIVPIVSQTQSMNDYLRLWQNRHLDIQTPPPKGHKPSTT